MTEIAFLPATELARRIRAKELSARESLDLYLSRIEQHNPKINAVVTLDAERALARAAEADDALARGESWGPLHGLPMTIKNSIETEGVATTSGAPELANHVPQRDADAVARLKAAGAIVFGKTNLPLYAGDLQSYNEVHGTTNNPWDPARIPGGSSGGAAAALSAGLTGYELGSDIGGSIRNPAHFCGVYGIKPTFGIVPGRGHIPGPPGALSDTDIAALGPMGRSPDDLDLGLDVLAGPASDRAVAWRLKLPKPRRRALKGYRVAAWLDDPFCPTDAEVLDPLQAAVEALRGEGVRVNTKAHPIESLEDSHLNFMKLLQPIFGAGLPDEAFRSFADMAGGLAPEDQSDMARWARNTTIRHRHWMAASEKRAHIRAKWAEFFTKFDVLVTPVMPTVAFPHDHSDIATRTFTVNGSPRSHMDGLVWAGLAGMVWLPAASAPIGLSRSGLPVGIHIIAPYLEDRTAIDFARRLTEVVGGYEIPPGY